MQPSDAAQRFAVLDPKVPVAECNYEHVRTKYLLKDGKRTLTDQAIRPGEVAPDFALPRSDGSTLRLSDLRGTPVLLHFGSYS